MASSDDPNTQLRRLLDLTEIRDLVYRYSYLVDQKRMGEWLDLFTEDCIVDFRMGRSNGPLHGRAALAKYMEPFGDGTSFRATSHHNANVLVDFIGEDQAAGSTSLYAWHEAPDGRQMELWGRYEDAFVRTPHGWRLSSRMLLPTAQRWTVPT